MASACATFFYSADGASESDKLPASALPALVAAGTVVASTLIYSEDDGFEFEGWTAWATCCGSFGLPPPAAAPAAVLCTSLTYSTDRETQSAAISAAEARALADAGAISADTLIFSEQEAFAFETWTRWAECCQCFGAAAPIDADTAAAAATATAPAAAAAVCSSLYYEGDSERLLRVSEALALVEAGTIGPATLIYSEQPAFDFDEWTPWAGCSFCFGVGERDAALASAAHEDEDGAARTCSSLYYSIDGASSSEELSVAAAHELVSAGAIVGDTLVYSEQAGFGYDGWTKWSVCSHCFPGPSSASHVAPRAVVCYGWLEKKGGDTHIDEHNVLQKERHYLKGGRRNWKRRWFVLHSDGELSYYSQGPKAPAAADGDAAAGGGKPKHSGDVIPHFMHWKGRLQLSTLGGQLRHERLHAAAARR